MNTSFTYKFEIIAPPTGNTRDPVLLEIDFAPVYAANPGLTVYLEYITLSGTRQNSAGAIEIVEAFAARLIGNFGASSLPVVTITVPRAGDSITNFDGYTFSGAFPLFTNEDLPAIPPLFQLEFSPSNRLGVVVGDKITVSFTIGFRVV